MYVANSEPTIWVCGGGRADVAEQAPISELYDRSALKLDGIRGRVCALPREALLLWHPEGARKPNREGHTPSGKGAEGGRSMDSTEDSGPMKPGNSVEEKTLTTGERRSEAASENRASCMSPTGCGKPWTKGESGQRDRVELVDGQGGQKTRRDGESVLTPKRPTRGGPKPSGPGAISHLSPAIENGERPWRTRK